MGLLQDVVEQGGFTAAQEACKDGDGNETVCHDGISKKI
jgi:hypothetical protein